MIKTSLDRHYEPHILNAVELVNANQKMILVKKVIKRFGEDLSGFTFAVWGLSFKPDTDDMRESPAITLIQELSKRGAQIHAYDPKAIREARSCYLKGNEKVNYFDGKYDALRGCDAMILVTDWKEFRSPDFELMTEYLKSSIIFEGKNQYNRIDMAQLGFEYYQIGVALD